MNTKKLVERIESRLYEIGKTKMEFYAESGISAASMSQWRNGKNMPKIRVLERLADYLRMPYDALVTGLDEKEIPAVPEKDDGLDSPLAWAIAWDQASPELRRAALAVLKSGELSAGQKDRP